MKKNSASCRNVENKQKNTKEQKSPKMLEVNPSKPFLSLIHFILFAIL